MKKCPNCQKTYDDSLKFCQVDGTPLVAVAEDTPEENPYKTVVGNASDLPIPPEEKKPEPTPEPEPEPEPELDPYATMVAGSKMPEPKEEDVLEVPETPIDPMATMVVSGQTSGNIEIDLPEEEEEEPAAPEAAPVSESAAPEAPAEEPVPETPAASPPVAESPYAAPPASEEKPAAPIPSPFEESMPPGFIAPTTPPFETPESPVEPEQAQPEPEPEPVRESAPAAEPEPLPTDFSDVSAADDIGEVEPALPAPSASAPMEASPSESPAVAAEGAAPNQTLAFVALGLGIIGLPCCAFYIFGLGAIVVGFIARGRANSDPENYGGGMYATIGLILGFVSVLLGTVLLIFQFLLGGLASLAQ